MKRTPSLSAGTMLTSNPMQEQAPEAAVEIDFPPLEAWLSKRHETHKSFSSQWGRRYLCCDDTKGRVWIGKNKVQKKAATILHFSEIASVHKAKSELSNAFVITCPPITLTLRCEDYDELQQWLDGLNARMAHWREKMLREGPQIAMTSTGEKHKASSADYGGSIEATYMSTGETYSSKEVVEVDGDEDEADGWHGQ